MMQDLVAPGCGPDGNAVQGFVRSFAQEKSEFQQVRQTIGHAPTRVGCDARGAP